jgi:hypothetical protein
MTVPLLLILALATGDPPQPQPAGRVPLQALGTLKHPPIREASGIVASRRHAGVFWVHNDSGNLPVLFAVERDGTLVREYPVKAPNLDWEDLAADGSGHLYIGDIGNNNGRLALRVIYRIDEPDPSQDHPPDERLPVTGAWYYRFPPGNGNRFDAEGLFIDGQRAIVVAKTFDRREAELFAIRLDAAAPLARPVLPERLGALPGFVEPATGASLAADGLHLAVSSYEVARVYRRDRSDTDRWTLRATVAFQAEGKAEGIEAITWDGSDLILAAEGRGLYRIGAAAWQAQAQAQAHRP